MINKLSIMVVIGLFFAMNVTARAGGVLDRIVATVNSHIILQSDWDDAVRCEGFIADRPVDTPEDRKGALDRLIDQELLREQMRASDFQPATDAEVSTRVTEIRKQYAEAVSESAWLALLARNGLTESELKEQVALQQNLMRLVDARLRPSVNIDSKSIESYYNQELIPQLRQAGAKQVALTEVTSKIKELLTQQKMSELLTTWLQSLRAGSEIRTMFAPPGVTSEAR